MDKSIFNRAVLCGALELLPQSWASMAIIPLQVKLVHGVAQVHGITHIDAGMVKEFIATAGVGLTGQYLEQFGRKLVGGLLGSVLGVLGVLGRGVGSLGTGMAMSFATTYALGQLAVRYYGGGRQMSKALLQQTYQDLTRLLEFGRYSAARRQRRGLGRPETFTFMGFTFICGKSRRGAFVLQRKTRATACERSFGRSRRSYVAACTTPSPNRADG
jgi:uncharacterized protein (DUF697 family)